MKLNQLPNFRVEDYPSEQSWIGRFFNQFNPFVQSVNQVFDQNVEFGSNIKSVTKEYTITSFQEFSLTWPFKDFVPMDLRVTKATKGTQLTPTILLAAWKYNRSNYLITVNKILEASETGVSSISGSYQFTIRATI